MRSWVVGFWERIFAGLAWVSFFRVLRTFIKPLRTAGGVEVWVSAHVVLALVSAYVAAHAPSGPLALVLVVYGVIRVFEITVYQVNVLLFDQLRVGQSYKLEGYTRLVLMLLLNYVEIILWFTAAYGVLVPQLDGVTRSLPLLLVESFATFTGFGSAHLVPRTTVALAVIWAESAAGLFMSIVILARFIGMLPVPDSRTPGEKREG